MASEKGIGFQFQFTCLGTVYHKGKSIFSNEIFKYSEILNYTISYDIYNNENEGKLEFITYVHKKYTVFVNIEAGPGLEVGVNWTIHK